MMTETIFPPPQVIEEMAKSMRPDEKPMPVFLEEVYQMCIESALSTPAFQSWLGNFLPELPDGWRLQSLTENHEGWHCVLLDTAGKNCDVRSNEYPKDRFYTPRAAVLAALTKIKG